MGTSSRSKSFEGDTAVGMMKGKLEVSISGTEASDTSATEVDSGAATEPSASEASGIFSSISVLQTV